MHLCETYFTESFNVCHVLQPFQNLFPSTLNVYFFLEKKTKSPSFISYVVSTNSAFSCNRSNNNSTPSGNVDQPDMCQCGLWNSRLQEDVLDVLTVDKARTADIGLFEHLVISHLVGWRHHPGYRKARGHTLQAQ